MKPKKYYTQRVRYMAIFCALNLFFNLVVLPTATYGVTSGPSQPEISSFASIDTSNMVDLFSGDFSYNIPLLELPGPNGGYPFNLAYNSGVSPEQEASWVGLGWNLTPGAIQRQMRGVPDEFNGGDDKVTKTTDMKNDDTFGLTVEGKLELFGFDQPKQEGALPTDTLGLPPMAMTVYYNTYKGLGYTLGVNPGLNLASTSSLGLTSGINFSLDSRDGVSISPSLGLQMQGAKSANDFNLGTQYNSRAGLTNLGLDLNKRNIFKQGININPNINLYNQGRVPSSETPMRTVNMSGSFSLGSVLGVFKHFEPQVFFSSQWSVKKPQETPAYGYLYSQEADEEGMMDINRDKQGAIFKESVSLSIPEATYDIFSVTGHGLQGAFRAYRSDIGIYGNPKVTSVTAGGALGGDYGQLLGPVNQTHIGIDVGINMGATKSTKWEGSQNKIRNTYKHTQVGDHPTNPLHEPFYFKFTNDRTAVAQDELAYIGDAPQNSGIPKLKPVRVALGNNSLENFGANDSRFKIRPNTVPALKKLEAQDEGGTYKAADITSPYPPTKEREARNTLVQQFTNAELAHIRLGALSYINEQGTPVSYDRSNRPSGHIGAFVVTKPDGARYIYGLPAYNNEHIERQLTVEGDISEQCKARTDLPSDYKIAQTDMHSSKTSISPYAYAHLLTAIVGDDYVDIDEIPGPSDGDIGYWVKFTYKLQDADYKWRTPFAGANFMPGFINTKLDDKGSYMYGSKEIYYVAKAETKSHVVTFQTSERQDGKGASSELQNTAQLGSSQLKLSSIKLYVKSALENNPAVPPLKTVQLGYANPSEELCQGVINRTGTGGKLTLKTVSFLYQNSTRGSYNNYTFHYAYNPDYNPVQIDRWGSYTSAFGQDECKYQQFPYVNQEESYANRDRDASAWLLADIDLPSGARISVDYESDDYAYVQNKVAMQMMPIAGVGTISEFMNGNNELHELANSGENHKVFFKLEKPLPTSLDAQEEVNKYIDKTGQIFFKSKIKLQKNNGGFPEFVTGYASIKETGRGLVSKNMAGYYTHGYITVESMPKGNKDHHPFSVAAWQHIRGKQPKLLLPNAPGFGDSGSGFKQVMRNVSTLASIIPELKSMFKGYYQYMYDKEWGREMDLENSWIRLNSPDRIKYGGGVRVKRILLNDQWQSQTAHRNSFYGQQYEYRMEENGELISSGVAAYEPQVGGEENALRYGEAYEQKLLLATDNHYFLEHPLNEGLYPSAQVGYRKITVKSLAAAHLAGEDIGSEASNYFVGAGFHATTGVTVHEFYTAKEFPVIVDRTSIDRAPYAFWIPLGIGQITMNGLTATQGFSVETNDMHGKPKQVTHYRQKPEGSLIETPVSWTKYNYKKLDRGVIHKGGEKAFGVDNRVEVLLSDDGTKEGVEKGHRLIGLEREFVVDMQEQTSWNGNVAADINIDIYTIPPTFIMPVVGAAPKIGASFNSTRSVTTNKIVSRSGILESVEAFDGTATLKTNNLLWDPQTAEVLLTSVNNSFDSLIYNYSIPARFHYEKTKAAYYNADFQTTVVGNPPDLVESLGGFKYRIDLSGTQNEAARLHLQEGDELIVKFTGETTFVPSETVYATITQKHESQAIDLFLRGVSLLNAINFDTIHLKVIRSGNRNLLGAKVGTITALVDPTESDNRIETECEKQIRVPSDCDIDTTGLSELAIDWRNLWSITIGQEPVEIEVIPTGGTETYTYLWSIYDENNTLVRSLVSYTRKIPISNEVSNPLSGNYTITCTITDSQERTITSAPRPIYFN